MVSASACIHVAVVQKNSRTPELKYHVCQKETSAETELNIKEPSADVKDATAVFEKLKESEEIISSLIVNETISAKVERLANLINFQRLKDPDHLLNS